MAMARWRITVLSQKLLSEAVKFSGCSLSQNGIYRLQVKATDVGFTLAGVSVYFFCVID